MKPVIWLAIIACILLAAFLWFRPVIGELGKATPPDATGRASHPIADGVSSSTNTGPGLGTSTSATPDPTKGGPNLAGITHPEELERKILELTNEERRKKGLGALQPEDTLGAIARGHSDDMLARNFFEHVNPDGLAPSDRIAIQHRRLIGLTGENIWMSSGLNPSDLNKMANEIMYGEKGWMNSPGHRANILRPDYTHLGVGISVRGGQLRATQNFAAVRAYTEQPIPAQVNGGASLNLSMTPFNSTSAADRYDYWVANRGINTGESYPVADGTVKPAAGVYKLRFYFLQSSSDSAARYSIYDGPQLEVR